MSIPSSPSTVVSTTLQNVYRTHNCGEIRAHDTGNTVKIAGWVDRKRDHGNVLFIDLRDRMGVTQLVIDKDSADFTTCEQIPLESVLSVEGTVVRRSPETVNTQLSTGEVELPIGQLTILSRAQTLPIPVNQEAQYPESMRLQYRYLDLRRPDMQQKINLRADIITSLRRRMTEAGFREYQTPILTASSPEGARDFLVPSRLHPGLFYALPQAPQQFKQLLMMAGFDRYFQIAPCFRDEDARADRSPGEFYQLDLEMSFVTQEDVFNTLEPILSGVFEEFAGERTVSKAPFQRIPYRESMLKYGSDKPDLRNPIEICDVSAVFAESDFKIFANSVAKGQVVRAIPAPKAGGHPRSFFDKLNDWARSEGQAGLGYIGYPSDGGATGPIAKNLGEDRVADIARLAGLESGDAVFFVCGSQDDAAAFAGRVRDRLGHDLQLIDEHRFEFCWIVDFPMFERDDQTGKIDFSHNPFSMPQGGLEALESQDPLDILAWQYDIVCNGIELSSGAIRNHLPEIMYKAFSIAGYTQAEVNARFSGMIEALKYGAPPHGGSAPGIDRMVMLLAGVENIREITAFPLNQQAQDVMMGAPGAVDQKQLDELGLMLKPQPSRDYSVE